MKKITHYLLFIAIAAISFNCSKKEDVTPTAQPAPQQQQINATDTLVKFTLFSNRVPFIYKRMVHKVWVQDTIKTNNAVRYETFDTYNYGYGYWVTMNLAGKSTDSLHITGEYKGKITQMSSPKYQSAAYVLIDNIK